MSGQNEHPQSENTEQENRAIEQQAANPTVTNEKGEVQNEEEKPE